MARAVRGLSLCDCCYYQIKNSKQQQAFVFTPPLYIQYIVWATEREKLNLLRLSTAGAPGQMPQHGVERTPLAPQCSPSNGSGTECRS